MSNWKSETPKGPCAIHATGGSVRRSHLPGRVRPQTSADLARGRELRAGSVGRPQARCAPSSYSRIPRILSPSSGPRLRSHPERRFRPWPRTEPSLPFPCWRPSLPLSFPFLSGPAHPRGREMARGWEGGGNLSPPPLPKSTTELLSADEPGLPLANSGELCSPQLFPGHLTCQLLGGRCC